MSKLKIQGKELRAIGYPEGPVISVAMNVMEKNFKHHSKEEAMEILKEVLQSPHDYASDEALGLIAKQLLPKPLLWKRIRAGYFIESKRYSIQCLRAGAY